REQYIKDAVYFPNGSYLDTSGTKDEQAFVYEEVKLLAVDAIVFPQQGKRILPSDDWMVMFVSRQISTEKAPDGQIRGFLKATWEMLDSPKETRFDMLIIGQDPEFAKAQPNETSSYQS